MSKVNVVNIPGGMATVTTREAGEQTDTPVEIEVVAAGRDFTILLDCFGDAKVLPQVLVRNNRSCREENEVCVRMYKDHRTEVVVAAGGGVDVIRGSGAYTSEWLLERDGQ